MTPLDKAAADAREDANKADAFYNLFLNSIIYVPVWDEPQDNGTSGVIAQDTISPVVLEQDGMKFVMLFDSEERLGAWAQRDIGIVGIPGHSIVQMSDPDLHWILNAGTEHTKEFVAKEIAWLKENVKRTDLN